MIHKIYYQWIMRIICKIFGHKQEAIPSSPIKLFNCLRCGRIFTDDEFKTEMKLMVDKGSNEGTSISVWRGNAKAQTADEVVLNFQRWLDKISKDPMG